MKLAVLGGSFNPVHLGHIALASSVIKELGYDKIAVVPAYISPFKRRQALYKKDLAGALRPSVKDRIKMIELAIEGNFKFYCEKYEIDKEGVSYTIDTIDYLYKKFSVPNEISDKPLTGKIGLIIGDDLARSFALWKDSDKIIEKTDVIVGRRGVNGVLSFDFPFTELKNPILPISSTQIRKAISEEKDFKAFVPPAVYEYIREHGLYK
ncbi:nicotinate (nicotinamide) nucleotide adenylyltransferase [Treponema pedis]|uniref:Probable nicotinate-nucleotide adenylyltransferase n=1 Tax=Treponema pedis TaxID=409322 RepID=A0A7S6WRN0_9SPIR|nr:nicotinate (nicotinamide) nucleotide adenylyltransferase [Treponema pedis]QOW61547.1 nicotinate (nicotinamide) nucleotide adenylyltransferase [Treponema pedis]